MYGAEKATSEKARTPPPPSSRPHLAQQLTTFLGTYISTHVQPKVMASRCREKVGKIQKGRKCSPRRRCPEKKRCCPKKDSHSKVAAAAAVASAAEASAAADQFLPKFLAEQHTSSLPCMPLPFLVSFYQCGSAISNHIEQKPLWE